MIYHINILELLAVKTYLMKIGGTQNLKMVELAIEIWEYLLKWGITITAEYCQLNVAADWESRNSLDSSE